MLELRQTQRSDEERSWAIYEAAYQELYQETWGAWDAAHLRPAFAARFAVTPFFLIWTSEPVGLLSIQRRRRERRHRNDQTRPDDVFLHELLFAPASQNQGYGSRIIGAAQCYAAAEGVPLRLTVMPANHGAQRFYQRLGFVLEATARNLTLRWQASPPQAVPELIAAVAAAATTPRTPRLGA